MVNGVNFQPNLKRSVIKSANRHPINIFENILFLINVIPSSIPLAIINNIVGNLRLLCATRMSWGFKKSFFDKRANHNEPMKIPTIRIGIKIPYTNY